MAPVARYTVLRLMVFFGVLCVLWLCQLRGIILVIVAALLSTLVSFFVLNRFRQQTVDTLESHVQARQQRTRAIKNAREDDDE